jgi:hypothetical protein
MMVLLATGGGDCGPAGEGGPDGGFGAEELWRLGLTRRTTNIPTTSSSSSSRIFRFVVRRW